MSFFKPEDFAKAAIHCCGACACDVVDVANAKRDEALEEAKKIIEIFTMEIEVGNKRVWANTAIEWLMKYGGEK